MSFPLFVIGVPRSGTTLLRAMLDSHPDLMCGAENPWLSFHPELPNLQRLSEHLLEEPAGLMACYQGLHRTEVEEETGRFFGRLMERAARARGKARWADKTPKNLLAVPFLRRLFPQARFVHLIRDGRDVALSTRACRWTRLQYEREYTPNDYEHALRRWVHWQDLWEGYEVGDRLAHSLHYERLVQDPESVMRGLLDFAELKWDPAVLRPYDKPHVSGKKQREGLSSYRRHGGLVKHRVRVWTSELTEWERELTRRLAEDRLLKTGYSATL